LTLKPEVKRPLGRPKRRWEDSIGMAIKETEWEVVEWIHLAQGWDLCSAIVNMIMKFWVT